MDVRSCDVSNNLDPKDPNKRGTDNYYLAPSLSHPHPTSGQCAGHPTEPLAVTSND